MKKTNVILYLVAALCWLGASVFVFIEKNVKLGILYLVLAIMNFVLAFVSKRKLDSAIDDNQKKKY